MKAILTRRGGALGCCTAPWRPPAHSLLRLWGTDSPLPPQSSSSLLSAALAYYYPERGLCHEGL